MEGIFCRNKEVAERLEIAPRERRGVRKKIRCGYGNRDVIVRKLHTLLPRRVCAARLFFRETGNAESALRAHAAAAAATAEAASTANSTSRSGVLRAFYQSAAGTQKIYVRLKSVANLLRTMWRFTAVVRNA